MPPPDWLMARWKAPGAFKGVEDAAAAGRLAKDCDVVQVAAKGGNVALYPVERSLLIVKAKIGAADAARLGGQFRMRKETEGAHAVWD